MPYLAPVVFLLIFLFLFIFIFFPIPIPIPFSFAFAFSSSPSSPSPLPFAFFSPLPFPTISSSLFGPVFLLNLARSYTQGNLNRFQKVISLLPSAPVLNLAPGHLPGILFTGTALC